MFDIALFKEIEKEGLENYSLMNIKEYKKKDSKEKEELLTLIEELPKLKSRNGDEVINKLIDNFIERYPTSVEVYECFSKFYLKIKDYKSALNLIYAALYIDKENGNMLNLLKYCEANLIKTACKIPRKYKAWILYPETRGYQDQLKTQNNNIISECLYSEKLQIMKHGQYYVALAKKKLLPGEVIFQTKPFILTQYVFSENYTYSTCYHCLKERVNTDKSYSCPINPNTCPYIFCNWDCLINNIRIHSIECRIIPTITAAAKEANLMYYTVLHIFRLLIKAGLDKEFKDEDKNILNEIFSVESYYDSVKESQKEVFESFNTLANRIILEFSSSFYLYLKQKELVELMLILWQYSPFIKYYSPSSIIHYANPETTFGLVYCPTLAKLHHSCVPTCVFNYDENGILTIRALCNIPEGGKLCINILSDQYIPLKIRKNFKGMPRVFGCGCVRCSDPTENNLHLRSMKCPKCITGYIYPIKTEALIEALKLYRIDKFSEKAQKKEMGKIKNEINSGVGNGNEQKTMGIGKKDAEERSEGRKSTANNMITKNNTPNNTVSYFNEKEKKILKKLGGEIERWICSNCGKLSLSGNRRCIKLENKAYLLYNEAEKNYMNGNIIVARKQLLRLYKDYFSIFHPNHYIIFNTNVLLAGLLRYDPNKQLFDSLYYLRKAVVSADQVLPICSLEKIHLYLHLADYTFASSNLHKLYNKGTGISPSFIIDPIYVAVWNSCVITGYNSTMTIVLIQRMRMFSMALNVFTPSKNIEYKIEREEEFSNFYYQVTQKKTDTYTDIKKIMDQDYFYPIYMATHSLDIDFDTHKYYKSIFKRFRKIQYFGNGLTALGLAASNGNVKLVNVLLKLKYSVFTENELNINALLAMASTFLPDEQTAYHSNYYYTLLKEIELQNVDFEDFENEYYSLTDATHSLNNLHQNNNKKDVDFFNAYNYKNAMEKAFNFDITLDEEFIYGEQSRKMDMNQAKILILFIKHLDKIHRRRKKKHKQFKDMENNIIKREVKSGADRMNSLTHERQSKSSIHTGNVKFNGKNEFNLNKQNNSFQKNNDSFSLERWKSKNGIFFDDPKNRNSEIIAKGHEKEVYGSAAYNDEYIMNNRSSSSSSSSYSSDSDGSDEIISDNDDDDDGSKKWDDDNNSVISNISINKNYNNSEFHSDSSEDVLNCKIQNYFTEKLLTKTISHKLLGLNNTLHYACARGKRELVKQLIISGMPIMLLNNEGSTPLHLACFNGHNEIVKILLKHKSDINALTCHGESPLMLATYCLHFDVVRTLIENNAELIVKNDNRVTILHCLVYGLLKTHTVYYKNKSSKDDIASLTVQGFSELNSVKYYTQGSTLLNIHFATSQIPIIEHISHDFFLFPYKLLHRLKKAILILKYLLPHCPLYLYEVKNSHGYNPSELLKVIWKKLCEKRMEVLAVSDLRVVAFTERQKNLTFQSWTLIISLVNMFLSILQPDQSVLTSIYKNFINSSVENEETEQKVQSAQLQEPKETTDTNGKANAEITEKTMEKTMEKKMGMVKNNFSESSSKQGAKTGSTILKVPAKEIPKGILKKEEQGTGSLPVGLNKKESVLKTEAKVDGPLKIPKKMPLLKKGFSPKTKPPPLAK